MKGSWRLLALAAVLHGLAGTSEAQNIVVRGAPPGATIEALVNDTTVGTAKADPRGDAVFPFDVVKHTGAPETGMNILVEVCPDVRRVMLLERGVRPPAETPACDRREAIGLFLVRSVSNVVVNVENPSPRVLLIQGRYSLDDPGPSPYWILPSRGLVLFGGGGLRTLRDVNFSACGNVSDCEGGGAGVGFTAGGGYWVNRYIGAEAAFVKPREAVVTGRGEAFEFTSSLDGQVVTVAGLVGVPINAVRLYGKVGGAYHRATFSTTQTNEDVTRTIGGVEVTIPGGSQTFELDTAGWGWVWGGGLEIWVTRGFSVYSEFTRTQMKGAGVDADGRLDEALTSFVAGVRFRIGP